MADVKKITVTPEAAQRLGEPIEKAREATERRDMLRRVNDLEYCLTKTCNALAVITRGLEDFANSHASPEEMTLTQADVSLMFGTVNLLEYVGAECDRAFWDGVER